MKKNSDPRALKFRVWGIQTSLGQFGPKVLCPLQWTYQVKPLDENLSFNFQKQDIIFSEIIR